MALLSDLLKSIRYASKGFSFDKAKGEGIKVDTENPTYPWRDLTGDLKLHGPGGDDPVYAQYNGVLKAYKFDNINDEMFIEFHIPHDYAPGTDIFIHAHWSHISAAVTTGSVTWGFDVINAKGHNQGALSTVISTSIAQDASTTQYQHMIAEVQMSAASPTANQIDTDDIEVDGIILARIYLNANTMDSATDPFLHFCDIHYQSTGIGTKDKSPDFYT